MTVPRDVRVFLADVLEHLVPAREFAAEVSSAEELAEDRRTLFAVVRALEIVGEATKQIPRPARERAHGGRRSGWLWVAALDSW